MPCWRPHLRLQRCVEGAGLLHVGHGLGSLSLHGSQLGAEAGGIRPSLPRLLQQQQQEQQQQQQKKKRECE